MKNWRISGPGPKAAPSYRTLGLIAAGLLFMASPAQADVIGFDMVGSASQNLNSFTNSFAGAFTSPGDGFQKYQRGVSASIPLSLLDDSLSIFPPDGLGIIDETNTDEFFGIADTLNGDNPTGEAFATWKFDISGFGNLSVSIDAGAMGDFEATNDSFVWSASIDGDPFVDLFTSSVDEDGSLTYTLSGGGMFTLNDPMEVGGLTLSNILQTLSSPLAGQGSELTLRLDANTNGGGEAMAFQNIVIEGDALQVPEPGTLAIFVIALGGLGVLARRRLAS